jgi:two-component system, OmpR family, alkaline phosphatase synthesis response regulator PhoP
MSRVALVEDETHIANGLRFNLEAEGHAVVWYGTGEAALEQLLKAEDKTDVVILDIMLPGINGFTVASRLREADRRVPILMLTALNRPDDVLKGFGSGADDFLPKPFDLRILLARVSGLLRRHAWTIGSAPPVVAAPTNGDAPFAFDGMTVDFQALELRTPRATHRMTLMEMDLLRYLIRHAGAVVSRKQILHDVWGLPEDMDTRAIDNFIVRLRKYIEAEPSRPKHLLTVRGIGYKFVAVTT